MKSSAFFALSNMVTCEWLLTQTCPSQGKNLYIVFVLKKQNAAVILPPDGLLPKRCKPYLSYILTAPKPIQCE